MRRVIKPYNLLDAKTHVIYNKFVREGKIPKKHVSEDREEMRKILKTICKHIATGMVECPGGVYIKGIGYFFNWKSPKKMPYHTTIKGKGLKENFNYHTNHYMFFPTYVPMASKTHFRSSWTMDKQFNHNIKKGVAEKLKSGFKYTNYLHSLKSL